jgi:hypothetical protein
MCHGPMHSLAAHSHILFAVEVLLKHSKLLEGVADLKGFDLFALFIEDANRMLLRSHVDSDKLLHDDPPGITMPSCRAPHMRTTTPLQAVRRKAGKHGCSQLLQCRA